MRPPRAVVVGAGRMGRWHARAAHRAGATAISVVDAEAARAAALAARLRGGRAAADLTAALAGDDAPVVHLCTPLASHAALAREALAAGCHVLVEKPFTESAEAARDLLALAERHGRLVAPVHQYLFQRGVARALADRAVLGEIRHVEVITCSAGAAGAGEDASDRLAAEIVPHALALLARLLPDALAGATWNVRRRVPGEWSVATDLAGVAVRIVVSMGGRPPRNELRLIGTRASVLADLFHGFAVREPGAVGRTAKATRPARAALRLLAASSGNLLRRALDGEVAYPGLERLVAAFYAAARSGGPSPIPPAEVLAVAAAWESVLDAAGLRPHRPAS